MHICQSDETLTGLARKIVVNLIRTLNATTRSYHPTVELAGTLEAESHDIEPTVRALFNSSSQHHISQNTGVKILEIRTPEDSDFRIETQGIGGLNEDTPSRAPRSTRSRSSPSSE